jgi:hypothetical protein
MMIHHSRRTFLATTAAAATESLWNPLSSNSASKPTFQLSDAQHRSLLAALESSDKNYDPAEKMISGTVSKIGYHTALKPGTKIHHTRSSFTYATACLDSGDSKRLERAQEIIDRVIDLQDQNPNNRTYGIWSWYYEEPLDKMSPPDWNWADFCSAQLLAAYIDHHDRLDKKLVDKIRDSIIHAANSIKKRNVSPGYTNIAIMGTYVSLAVGEYLGLDEFKQYGKERLHRFYNHLNEQGSFSEYNSSTYTIVAIAELSRMMMHIHTPEHRPYIESIYDKAWKHAASHFHAPTQQWAGPNSRCYSTLLRESTLAFLENATGNTKKLLDKDPLPIGITYVRLKADCPEKYRDWYFSLSEPRSINETFSKSRSGMKTIGYTDLHPEYNFGIVNHGDFWVQRRPFVAYWGTAEKPTYLQLRFLHDNYDYTSALISNTQINEGKSLSTITFATDYGDTHPSLDKVKNATIKAKDLRLRFEFGGNLDGLQILRSGNFMKPYVITHNNVHMIITPIADRFGDWEFVWVDSGDESHKWIDAIAYSGEEKSINFNDLRKAFLVFTYMISTTDQPLWRTLPNNIKMDQNLDLHLSDGRTWTINLKQKIQPDKRNTIYQSYSISSSGNGFSPGP